MSQGTSPTRAIPNQPACDPTMSTMRNFLVHTPIFTWPSQAVTHTFYEDPYIEWLDWERCLSVSPDGDDKEHNKGGSAFVDQVRIKTEKLCEINFPEPFAKKELVNPEIPESERNEEVRAMTDLRHPHVAALLGTYTLWGRLHLLIFPAGCFDLGDFMKCISMRLRDAAWQPEPPLTEFVKSRELYEKCSWPYRETLQEQLVRLEKYFVCLCQALKYLHKNNVRHKDIKPENILIDISGNVIVTDFGISTKFEPTASHSTNRQNQPCTERYKPPEMTSGGHRDDRSDVWSMGCVFLEMASLLLGFDMSALDTHFGKLPDQKQKPRPTFCDDVSKIHTWIESLERSSNTLFSGADRVKKHYLPAIRRMLQKDKEGRPISEYLWKQFDYLPQRDRCRDCHPEAGAWKPNDDQIHKLMLGNDLRKKIIDQEEKRLSQPQEVDLTGIDQELFRVRRRTNSFTSSSKGGARRQMGHSQSVQELILRSASPNLVNNPSSRKSLDLSNRPKSPSPLAQANELPGVHEPAEHSPRTPTSRRTRFSDDVTDIKDAATTLPANLVSPSPSPSAVDPDMPSRSPFAVDEDSSATNAYFNPAPPLSESLVPGSWKDIGGSTATSTKQLKGIIHTVAVPEAEKKMYLGKSNKDIVIKCDGANGYRLSFVTFRQLAEHKMVGFSIPAGRNFAIHHDVKVIVRIDMKTVANMFERCFRRLQGFSRKRRKLYIVNFAPDQQPTHLVDVNTQNVIKPG